MTDVATPRARAVALTGDSLAVDLEDGRTISVPLAWYPRLVHGTPDERSHWQLIGGGEGIHWQDLDEDIRVEDLLQGRRSGESQRSLAAWLASRAGSEAIRLHLEDEDLP
jgi:hypothetical protein